jgi:hypothetical protein
MMTPDEILEYAGEMAENNEIDLIQFPDLKSALIGWAEPWNPGGTRPLRLVYSASKCIEALMEQGMDDEEAREWLCVNTEGGYLGPHTPIVMHGDWT